MILPAPNDDDGRRLQILEANKGLNVSLLFSENSFFNYFFDTLQLFLYKILLNCSSAEGELIFENNCWAMSLLLYCESKHMNPSFFSLFNHETYLILEFF